MDVVDKEKVAIKIMKKNQFKTSKEITRVKTEVKILKKMTHPHVIKTKEVFEDKKRLYIVMENCPKGDLFDYIKSNGKLEEDHAKKLFKQLISAIEYLARSQVAHRDIKPENILFDKHMNLKLADFGLAQF